MNNRDFWIYVAGYLDGILNFDKISPYVIMQLYYKVLKREELYKQYIEKNSPNVNERTPKFKKWIKKYISISKKSVVEKNDIKSLFIETISDIDVHEKDILFDKYYATPDFPFSNPESQKKAIEIIIDRSNKIEMNDRDFWIFVSGYIKSLSVLDKIPSSFMLGLQQRMLIRESAYMNRPRKTYIKESKYDFMRGYNDDLDPDQQSGDFW